MPDANLPEGFTARPVTADDLDDIVRLVERSRAHTRGAASADPDALRAEAIGIGSWTRRQIVVLDPDGRLVGWASAHDRAAGRTDLTMFVDRSLDNPASIALPLLDWLQESSVAIAIFREEPEERLEMLVDEGDTDLQAWLAAHGHHHARTWLNMSRPVSTESFPPLREGVEVRRVATHDLGDGTTMPVAEDLRCVHRMLEESFADHFNSYRESFPEFVQRLREDPGHRWDHWWLAYVDGQPGGALVCTVTPPDPAGVRGSYVEYIGVHRDARGRGVAKALLNTVLGDAASRGRDRVGLEVDADSPTGADGLYRAMGWETAYVTQSWHKDLVV
jgi:mycothiol synthase